MDKAYQYRQLTDFNDALSNLDFVLYRDDGPDQKIVKFDVKTIHDLRGDEFFWYHKLQSDPKDKTFYPYCSVGFNQSDVLIFETWWYPTFEWDAWHCYECIDVEGSVNLTKLLLDQTLLHIFKSWLPNICPLCSESTPKGLYTHIKTHEDLNAMIALGYQLV